MGLKVADLYVDVHTDTTAIGPELRAALEDTDLTLPLDKLKAEASKGAPAAKTGEAAEDGMKEAMGDAVQGGLLESLMGAGGASGAITAIASAVGISAAAVTGILAVVGGVLAVIAGIAVIAGKLLMTAIANSQIVGELRSYLGQTLGMLFDTAIILIIGAIAQYVAANLESIQAFWETLGIKLEPIAGVLQGQLLPAFERVGRAISENIWPILKGMGEIWGGLLPYLETALKFISTVIGPAAELTMGFIRDIIVPNLQSLFSVVNTFLYPILDNINKLLDGPLGEAIDSVVNVLVKDIFPIFRDYVFPILTVMGEILGAIFNIALFPIMLQLQIMMPIIAWAIENILVPAVKNIIVVMEPIFQGVLSFLQWIEMGISVMAEKMDAAHYAEVIQTFLQEVTSEPKPPPNTEDEGGLSWNLRKLLEELGLTSPLDKDHATTSAILSALAGASSAGSGGGGSGESRSDWYPGKYGEDIWNKVSGGYWD